MNRHSPIISPEIGAYILIGLAVSFALGSLVGRMLRDRTPAPDCMAEAHGDWPRNPESDETRPAA